MVVRAQLGIVLGNIGVNGVIRNKENLSDKMLILLPVGILLIILYFEYRSRQKRKAAKQERRRNTDVE